jgi:hypothetical protein
MIFEHEIVHTENGNFIPVKGLSVICLNEGLQSSIKNYYNPMVAHIQSLVGVSAEMKAKFNSIKLDKLVVVGAESDGGGSVLTSNELQSRKFEEKNRTKVNTDVTNLIAQTTRNRLHVKVIPFCFFEFMRQYPNHAFCANLSLFKPFIILAKDVLYVETEALNIEILKTDDYDLYVDVDQNDIAIGFGDRTNDLKDPEMLKFRNFAVFEIDSKVFLKDVFAIRKVSLSAIKELNASVGYHNLASEILTTMYKSRVKEIPTAITQEPPEPKKVPPRHREPILAETSLDDLLK